MIIIVHKIASGNAFIFNRGDKGSIVLRAFWIRNGAGSVRDWTNGERFGL